MAPKRMKKLTQAQALEVLSKVILEPIAALVADGSEFNPQSDVTSFPGILKPTTAHSACIKFATRPELPKALADEWTGINPKTQLPSVLYNRMLNRGRTLRLFSKGSIKRTGFEGDLIWKAGVRHPDQDFTALNDARDKMLDESFDAILAAFAK